MTATLEHPADEIRGPQRFMNDLVGLLALSASWIGRDPTHIARTLLSVLESMLALDLVFLRLIHPVTGTPVLMARVAPGRELPNRAAALGALLDQWLGEDPLRWPPVLARRIAEGELSLLPLRLGLESDLGVLVAGSMRPEFPGQTERLLVTVATNQAVIALQEARLLAEQKRLAETLERRVEERTAELDRARSELAHVTRVTSLGMLAASIAHEVNQPLSGIVTNASTCLRMLACEPPNIEGARETVRRTIRDGHRASEIVNRLRGLFSRNQVAAEPIDLNAAVREVLALMASQLRRGAVVVREELSERLPTVAGDRVQLQQVVLNLIINAADAMREVDDRPRELMILTRREEHGGVCVSVRDSGVGFPPEDMDRLFQAFYSTKPEGMGIGLSVSRSVIERHGGRLWAVRNEGPGATFTFSLPVEGDTKV